MGEYLGEKLKLLKATYPIIKDVRGIGLMFGVELNIDAKLIPQKCAEKGLLINCTHDRVLRLMQAINISRNEIDKAVKILGEVFKECA